MLYFHMQCIKCGSNKIVKNGFKKLKTAKVQKYKCQDCNKYFTGAEKFHHLTENQKRQVFMLLDQGYKKHHIAKELGVYLRAIQYCIEMENKKEEDYSSSSNV